MALVITSRQHPIVKEFRELAHGADASMLLDGWHLLTEAVAAGIAIETVAWCGPPTTAEQITLERAQRGGAHVIEVSGSVLNALSPVNAPTGVVASAKKPRVDAQAVLQPAPALILAGVAIQDPGNAGAVVRAAAAAGATGVVVDEATANPWGWKALRASMGAAFHVPVSRPRTIVPAVEAWRAAGVSIVAAVARGGTPMYRRRPDQADRPPARRRRRGAAGVAGVVGRRDDLNSDEGRGRVAQCRRRRRAPAVRSATTTTRRHP